MGTDEKELNGGSERIEIDPRLYVATLEAQLAEATIQLVRTRTALEAMTRAAVEFEGGYQTDEGGELIDG